MASGDVMYFYKLCAIIAIISRLGCAHALRAVVVALLLTRSNFFTLDAENAVGIQ